MWLWVNWVTICHAELICQTVIGHHVVSMSCSPALVNAQHGLLCHLCRFLAACAALFRAAAIYRLRRRTPHRLPRRCPPPAFTGSHWIHTYVRVVSLANSLHGLIGRAKAEWHKYSYKVAYRYANYKLALNTVVNVCVVLMLKGYTKYCMTVKFAN